MATGDQATFDQLLHSFSNPDNAIRTQAELTYNNIPLTTRLSCLLTAMTNSAQDQQVRTMAAVLARRLFSSQFEELWPQIGDDEKMSLKSNLLLALQQEPAKALKKKICEAVAELCRNSLDDEGNNLWPETLKFMFDMARSEEPLQRQTALTLFSLMPGIFGNQQLQHLDVIKQMLYTCLVDQSSYEVRFESVKASCNFLMANESDGAANSIEIKFRDLLPPLVQTVAESMGKQDDDSCLKCLIDICETLPKFVRPQIQQLIELCLKYVGDTEVESSWRHLALEVLVTLSETAPQMLRKRQKFLDILVPQLLAMMVDLDDEDDWSVKDEVEDEDTDSNPIAGESGLDRICCGLGGKVMLPHIMANIPPMLQQEQWQYRHAGLMAVSACGEGCHQQMEAVLDQVVAAVIPFCGDQHPRVRYAACNALGQLSTDFAPSFQKKNHNKVIEALLSVLDDHANPRVQAHAGAAIVNFCEDCPKNILSPYLEPIINKLEAVLMSKFQELVERGTKLVLEQVVTTLASVADTVGEPFSQYYDRFMPALKYIIENASQPELKLLRGKTIECISLIGLAVGREKFMGDCQQVMQLLLQAQTEEEMADDDPQVSYMISAWTRMCKILGKDFQPYLPLVMGPVLKAAAIKPEVTVVDSDEARSIEGDNDWQLIQLGDAQSIGIRTAGLEDKATACQMLVCYARELKGAFAEYTQQVVNTMVPLLKFYFHDDVRIAAAEIMPFLLDCGREKGEQYVAEMWAYMCPEMIKAAEGEPESDVLADILRAISECVEKLGGGCLVGEPCTGLMKCLSNILGEHMKKQEKRQEKRRDEDYDEDLEEELMNENEEDVYILSRVSDVVHAMFGTHKEDFLPYFDELVPHFVKLLGSDRPWHDRQWSLCAWDDLIENCKEKSATYQHLFIDRLMQSLADNKPEVRQAAVYGIGVMAMHCAQLYAAKIQESLQVLIQMINQPDSRNDANINPTENAISAVTKILVHCPNLIQASELLPHWFGWLPVWEDHEEAEHIYGYLFTLIEQENAVILGENNSNLPRIISILAVALEHDAFAKCDAQLLNRMRTIIQRIQANEEIFEALCAPLSQEQKLALSTFIAVT